MILNGVLETETLTVTSTVHKQFFILQ